MTKERNHATRSHAGMARIFDNADATPEQVCDARDWGAIPAASARAWLAGFNAGLKTGGTPPAPARVTLFDEAREA